MAALAKQRKTVVVIASYAESLTVFRGPLLRALIANGHRVIACAPAAPPAVASAIAAMNVTFLTVPLERTGLRPDKDLKALRSLMRLLRDIAPDVVFSYTVKPVIYGSLAARWTGVPHRFAMITGLGYMFGTAPGLKALLASAAARILYRVSLRNVDRVFFQNPDDQAEFVRLGLVRPGQCVRINGSGVDLDAFRPTPLPVGNVSFLLIARFLVEKGLREYAEAARRIRAVYPNAVFRLVGWIDEGNPAALSEAELRAWTTEGIIDYVGRLDDVRPALTATSVYVLPSYYREGTPRTVLEAMAMGRPIVTTDAPGCRETVEDGVNGYLVRPRDVDSLVAALTRFLVEPESIEVMGRESRHIAVEKYDVHKVNAVILETMGLSG